ncbi:MAG TPA: penicillin-binding protein 2 [Candidatus Saccharimonadales bacterium]|nr:penicillin-binding protein 2 [Candidatus Saccharimonadales bacterium]
MKLELQKGSRSKILAAIVLGFMAIFVARLFYLQIIQHGYYVELANSEQLKRLTIPAKRGVIYALDGQTPVPLVMNQPIYTVFADPQIIDDDSKIIEVIKKVAGGNARSDLQSLLDRKESRYQILATKVTRTQADKIKDAGLSGIGFQEESQRFYPEGSLAAQALGFVDYSGTGRYGVEGALNDRLIGTDGLLQSVTDVRDVPLTIGNKNINKPAVNGDNLVLTIDRNIQSKSEKALADGLKRTGATRGSVIVMNPQNGKVMAMANLPTYSPAEFNKVTDAAAFNNAVVSVPYEPGSVIKTFTMATALDKRVITPTSTYVNTDYIKVGDRVISNATKGQTGTITFQHALNWSLNTGLVTVAQRLGNGKEITRGARDTMYQYFHDKFKLGQATGIEVGGEQAGRVVPPTVTEGNAVRYSNMSFGQGLDATMIQVTAGFASLVNGGSYYTPTIIEGVLEDDGTVKKNDIKTPTRPISTSTAEQIREMVHISGTSLSGDRYDKPGYYIGGKTGTSEVLKNGAYSTKETIATYLGFGGDQETTRYVIMVQVSADNKLFGGFNDAKPIFTDISNWMLDYLKVQPKR